MSKRLRCIVMTSSYQNCNLTVFQRPLSAQLATDKRTSERVRERERARATMLVGVVMSHSDAGGGRFSSVLLP